MSNFDNMGKEELRAACKAAAVKGWGKMNNTQMREALNAKQADYGIPADIKSTEAPVDEVAAVEQAEQEADLAQNPDAPEHQADAPVEQIPVEDSRKPVVTEEAPAPAPVAAPKSKSAGTKIQKDRPEQNGVKRPSAGTICAAIWDALDIKRIQLNGATPSFKDLKAMQDANGWQRNTAVTQYQRWKEFHDLMVR